MRTVREIQAEVRLLKREMKENHVRRFSCFMGGHTAESYRCNSRLFALSVELDRAKKRAGSPVA